MDKPHVHAICKTRREELGDRAKCCYCDPHLFCDLKIADLKAKAKKQPYKIKKYKNAKLF